MLTSITFGRSGRKAAYDQAHPWARRRERNSGAPAPSGRSGEAGARQREVRRLALQPSARLLEQLQRCGCSGTRSAPAAIRLRLMLQVVVRWAFDHPDAYWLVLAAPHALSPVPHETPADLSTRCYEIFAGAVCELAAEKRLRIAPAEAAAQTLWQAGLGLGAMARCLPVSKRAPADELVSHAVERLIADCLPA